MSISDEHTVVRVAKDVLCAFYNENIRILKIRNNFAIFMFHIEIISRFTFEMIFLRAENLPGSPILVYDVSTFIRNNVRPMFQYWTNFPEVVYLNNQATLTHTHTPC